MVTGRRAAELLGASSSLGNLWVKHRPQRRRLHALEKHGPDRRVKMAYRKGLARRCSVIELRAGIRNGDTPARG